MNELLNLRNLRSNYNFSNIFKSTDTSDTNSMQDLVNCDYCDPEEFKNLLYTAKKIILNVSLKYKIYPAKCE